jgi:hypothetical protein
VGALVDVGAGMHPELTGYENIFLYGAILGLSRREIRARFDRIVEFSELEEFLDVPVKRYSSGMKIRLGFSVAAHLDPDILLVDEVLAVGDVAFQRKCLERIRALREAGTTIVFVSHELATVEKVCERAVLVHGGRIVDAGRSQDVVRRYQEAVEREFVEKVRRGAGGNGAFSVDRVVLTDTRGVERFSFRPGEWVTVNWYYRAQGGPPPVEFMLKVTDSDHATILAARSDGRFRTLGGGEAGLVRCTFRVPALASRPYQVWGHVVRLDDGREEVAWQPLAAFAVVRDDNRRPELPWGNQGVPLLEVPVRWGADGRGAARARGRVHAAPSDGSVRSGGAHLAAAPTSEPARVASGARGQPVVTATPDAGGSEEAGGQTGRADWARWKTLFVLGILAGGLVGVLLGGLR